MQCKECFKFIFFRGENGDSFWKSAAEWNATGFPHWQGFSHRRSSPPVGWTRTSTLPLPSHIVLNSTIALVIAFSTSALRNSWTYQQSVSPGLTPTVTRKWSPLVCNELMKHPWKCTVCTVHCTRQTIACDWVTLHSSAHDLQRSNTKLDNVPKLDNLVLTAPTRDKIPTCPKHPPACPLETLKSDFWGRKSKFLFGGNIILASEGETH